MGRAVWFENQKNSCNFSLILFSCTFAAWLTSFVYFDEIIPPPTLPPQALPHRLACAIMNLSLQQKHNFRKCISIFEQKVIEMTRAFNEAPALANLKKKSLSGAPKWAFWVDTSPSKPPHSDYSINTTLKSEPLPYNYLALGLMRRLGGAAAASDVSSHKEGRWFNAHPRPLSRRGVGGVICDLPLPMWLLSRYSAFPQMHIGQIVFHFIWIVFCLISHKHKWTKAFFKAEARRPVERRHLQRAECRSAAYQDGHHFG